MPTNAFLNSLPATEWTSRKANVFVGKLLCRGGQNLSLKLILCAANWAHQFFTPGRGFALYFVSV